MWAWISECASPSTAARGVGWSLRALPIVLLAAAACGDEGDRAPPLGAGRAVAGCEGFSYATCDILTDACQRQLFGLMACLYGEPDAGDPPPVRLLDEASVIGLISE